MNSYVIALCVLLMVIFIAFRLEYYAITFAAFLALMLIVYIIYKLIGRYSHNNVNYWVLLIIIIIILCICELINWSR